MKSSSDHCRSVVGRLNDWFGLPTPPWSLAIGSNCGCDLSHLETEICNLLNRSREYRGRRFTSFDHEDIRYLAGQPPVRRYVIEKAGLTEDEFERWNDYEMVLRGLASIGGLVLGGKAAMDATHELPNVCRVMLSTCDNCREDGLSGRIQPSAGRPEMVVPEIISAFREWTASHDPMETGHRR